MAAPEYVPGRPADRPRTYSSPDHVPEPWRPDRPGDLVGRQPRGRGLGNPGPDQGYGLVLANRFRDRLALSPGQDVEDVVRGCHGIGIRRSSLFGRAPVIHDLELAYGLWGYLDAPPAELVTFRKPLFAGASHHYWDQRAIVDLVPEPTLRLTPAEVRRRVGEWRSLLDI